MVTRSSIESKFRLIDQGICEGMWILRVLKELEIVVELPLKLYCDNNVIISITYNLVQHDQTKHIEIDRHFINEKIDSSILYLPCVPFTQQTSDILTKSLERMTFEYLIRKLDMIDIYAPWGQSVRFGLVFGPKNVQNGDISINLVWFGF